MSNEELQPVAAAQPTRVLLAVGDQQLLTYLGSLLTKVPYQPYRLFRAKTLEQTVQAMARGLCDVVLLNYYWGQTRVGDKVLQWAKAKQTSAPIIALTRDADLYVDKVAVQRGAADYLVISELTQSYLHRSIRYSLERSVPRAMANHRNYYDYLTDLPNRLQFQNRLQQAIKAAATNDSKLAVMLLDIKGFKAVNDLYGEKTGDLLLQQVAATITQVVGNWGTTARMGDDEFAVLLADIRGPHQPQQLAAKILAKLSSKMVIGDYSLVAQCSIGITLYPAQATTLDECLHQAYTALERAKQDHHSDFQFYTEEFLPATMPSHSAQKQFIEALVTNQIGLYFNPRIHCETQEIIAIEVNPYWSHPQKGLLEYEDFLWNGLNNDIASRFSEWLLGTSFEYFKQLNIARSTRLVFNIEFQGLFSLDFPKMVEKYAKKYGIVPSRLEFDLSKVAVEKHSYLLEGCMERLHDMGVTFGINHFGSDEVSLVYLKKLPINVFKLSKEFLDDIKDDNEQMLMVKALVDFTHSLGKTIVIEGLHSHLPVDEIQRLGFDAYKSFFSVDAMSLVKLQHVMESPALGYKHRKLSSGLPKQVPSFKH